MQPHAVEVSSDGESEEGEGERNTGGGSRVREVNPGLTLPFLSLHRSTDYNRNPRLLRASSILGARTPQVSPSQLTRIGHSIVHVNP